MSTNKNKSKQKQTNNNSKNTSSKKLTSIKQVKTLTAKSNPHETDNTKAKSLVPVNKSIKPDLKPNTRPVTNHNKQAKTKTTPKLLPKPLPIPVEQEPIKQAIVEQEPIKQAIVEQEPIKQAIVEAKSVKIEVIDEKSEFIPIEERSTPTLPLLQPLEEIFENNHSNETDNNQQTPKVEDQFIKELGEALDEIIKLEGVEAKEKSPKDENDLNGKTTKSLGKDDNDTIPLADKVDESIVSKTSDVKTKELDNKNTHPTKPHINKVKQNTDMVVTTTNKPGDKKKAYDEQKAKKKQANSEISKNNEIVKQKNSSTNVLANLDPSMKFSAVFLTIITFGIFYFYLMNKIETHKNENEKRDNEPQELKVSSKIPFDIDKLINQLGGKDNIINVNASLNTLKISFKEKTKINDDAIKTLGAKGLMFANNKLSIIFGDYAIALKDALIKKLELEVMIKSTK